MIWWLAAKMESPTSKTSLPATPLGGQGPAGDPARQAPAKQRWDAESTAQSASRVQATSQRPAGTASPQASLSVGATHSAADNPLQAADSVQVRLQTPQTQLRPSSQGAASGLHQRRKCVSPPVGSLPPFAQLTARSKPPSNQASNGASARASLVLVIALRNQALPQINDRARVRVRQLVVGVESGHALAQLAQ